MTSRRNLDFIASPALPIAAGLAMSLLILWLILHMGQLGSHIPQPHILGDYLTGWLYALLFMGILLLLPVYEKRAVCAVWAVKSTLDLSGMLFYEQHYGLDAYGYYDYGAWGHHHNIWPVFGNGTLTMLHFSVLAALFTGTSYHAMKLAYSFVALFGCYWFYRAACHYLDRRDARVLYFICFIPSVLFWSSILGKDPVAFFGTGLYAFGVVAWLRTQRLRYCVPLVLGVAIAMFIREWYGFVMIAPVLIVFGLRMPRLGQRIFALLCSLAAIYESFKIFRRQFALNSIHRTVLVASTMIKNLSYGGSADRFQGFHTTLGMLKFLPWGIFTALYRPLPWDIRNPMMVLNAFEGSALLLLSISAFKYMKFRDLRDPVILWAWLFIGCWAVLYGIGGYGNLGMLVRERLQIMPVFAMFVTLFGWPKARWNIRKNYG